MAELKRWAEGMRFDQVLGQPFRPVILPMIGMLPFAMAGLIGAKFLPSEYYEWVWVPSFLIFAGCALLWTPYLLLVGICFYAMSQLPFPKSLALEAWFTHALLLAVVALLLWRTWVLWPDWAKKKPPLPEGAKPAPWWGYVLGGIAAIGLFVLMAYFFHFQDP